MANNKLTQQALNRILRGSHGHVWWKGKELATVQIGRASCRERV